MPWFHVQLLRAVFAWQRTTPHGTEFDVNTASVAVHLLYSFFECRSLLAPPPEGCEVLRWVCPFVCLSVFARSSSDGVAIRYVLPVFVDDVMRSQLRTVHPYGASCIFLSSDRTRITTEIPTKLWSSIKTGGIYILTVSLAPGAKSSIYDCLVVIAFVDCRYIKHLVSTIHS